MKKIVWMLVAASIVFVNVYAAPSKAQKKLSLTLRKNSRKITLIPRQEKDGMIICSWKKYPLQYASDKIAYRAATREQQQELYRMKFERQSKLRDLYFKINQEKGHRGLQRRLQNRSGSFGASKNFFSDTSTGNLRNLVNFYKAKYDSIRPGRAQAEWNCRYGHIVSWADALFYLEDPTAEWKAKMDKRLEDSYRYPGSPSVIVSDLPADTVLGKDILVTIYYTGKDASGNDLCTVNRAKAQEFWSTREAGK